MGGGVPVSRLVLLSTQEHWCLRPQEPSEKPRTQREARAHPTSHRLAVSAWPPCTYPKLLHVPGQPTKEAGAAAGPAQGTLDTALHSPWALTRQEQGSLAP